MHGLPTGLFGEYAKLLTPMDNEPFAAERAVSLSVSIWQRSAEGTDAKTAEAAFDAMLARLRKESCGSKCRVIHECSRSDTSEELKSEE